MVELAVTFAADADLHAWPYTKGPRLCNSYITGAEARRQLARLCSYLGEEGQMAARQTGSSGLGYDNPLLSGLYNSEKLDLLP